MQIRYPIYFGTIVLTAMFNYITGIRKLKLFNQGMVYFLFFLMAECLIRIKQSSKIFYSIPTLPSP